MAEDGELSNKQQFLNQETFQRTPETSTEHRFPVRAAGTVEVPLGSRGPRSLYVHRSGDSFGFTLRHFIIYPPESIAETDGRHAAVGALLTPMETIFVKNVAEGGPAHKAGLQKGDRIVYVNNVSVSNLSYSQVVQKIQTSPVYLHLLVVPKEEDVLQKYFAETAHNPLSNQQSQKRQRADAVSWRSLQNSNYNSLDYGRLVPKKQLVVHQQKSADNIYSSVRGSGAYDQRSAENIYSTPRDRKSLEIYAEPIINDSTRRPRAQPQVPLYKKMGRRASEGSSTVSDKDYALEMETSKRTPYLQDSSCSSSEMPALSLFPIRRESSSSCISPDGSKDSLASFDSNSTVTGEDNVFMTRLKKSVQEKEEFLRRPSGGGDGANIPRIFYSRPKKLDKPVWPPTEQHESPSRMMIKPTHQNFQRVKDDIEVEREITNNHESQPKNAKAPKDWQFTRSLSKIQEASVAPENTQANGSTPDVEDRRNYPPNIQMVSKRARQFETGRIILEDDPLMSDRTSFYRSELARLSAKKALPTVAWRTREFESLSNEPRREQSASSTSSNLRRSYRDSRSLDSSGSNCSIGSSIAENTKQLPGNFSIPIGNLPSNENQSNRMRVRSNSTGSWVAVMQTETSVDTNKSYGSDSTTRTGYELNESSLHAPDLAPLIPEPVERMHATPTVSVTPAPPVQKTAPSRPTQLDLGAPKRPVRHLRPPQPTGDTPPPVQPVCADKPLVVRRTKNTNITDEDRVMRRESYLKATEGGRMMHFESNDFSDGDVSPQVLRSAHRRWRPPLIYGDIQQLRKLFEDTASSLGGSVSGGSSSSVSLDREKNTASPCEKDKTLFVREGPLHCKITEIDAKKSADRSWKQIWAVLRGPRLFLYKDRHHQSPVGTSDVSEQSLAAGIDMRGSCVQVADDYTKRRNVFRVSSVVPCRSELLLQAEGSVELAEWVQALQEQVASNTDVEASLDQTGGKQQAVPQTVPATTSIQVPQQSKSKLPSLRTRSPTGQSPVSKTRKPSQINDPSTSPKSKTWRGRVANKFRKMHQGASSPSSPTAPEGSTFGNPLEHCFPSTYNPYVPRLVEICTEIVENRGLETIGIYRVPGNNAAVTALTDEVNKCYDEVVQLDPRWADVHVVSSLIKSFFRKMPDSLLTMAAYPHFIEADKIDNPNARMEQIRRLVQNLPVHHFNTLKHLILHLKRIVDHSDVNKMEARNLAIVFGPTIVRGEDNMEKMVNDMTHQCKIVESLLLFADWFFTEDAVESLNLPAPIATAEIFSNEPESSAALLRSNISKVEGMSQTKEQKDKFMQVLFSAARYKRKGVNKGNQHTCDFKEELPSPNGHQEFRLEYSTNGSNSTDLKKNTTDTKPDVIPTTVTEMETTVDGGGKFFNYKTDSEKLKQRVENFVKETQSNLQRPRKPECNSNNSLELRLPNDMSNSASNVRLSLNVNPTEQRVITKTHSASNVYSRTSDGNAGSANGRNSLSAATQCRQINYKKCDKQNKNNTLNSSGMKDSFSDLSSNSSDSRILVNPALFALRRGSSAENITNSVDFNANGNLKKVKYECEMDSIQKTGSLDSLNKLHSNFDDGGDLVTAMTKLYDEKKKELTPSMLSTTDNIPYVDESPEKLSRQSITYLNKENIPSSPKLYRNPSLHKSQYTTTSKLYTYQSKDVAKIKEKQEEHFQQEKDEDSSRSFPDNDRHLTDKNSALNKKVLSFNLSSGNSKLKRSESLNKPERTASPLNIKLKRSESLNKASDKLKRADSLTKNEKTECNINKKRETNGSARRATKDLIKLKRKNGMPERSIKRRHTVGGTKDPDKITLIVNRTCAEINDVNDNNKEKNLRTSSPDLSSTRRERFFFEVNLPETMFVALIGARPQSFPESTVYKVPLESHV